MEKNKEVNKGHAAIQEEHFHLEKMEKIKNEQKFQELEHQREMENISLGWFGRIFGSKENSSKNITGFICLSFILGGTLVSIIVYLINNDLTFVESMWGKISPIITLSLGYLFGKNSVSNNS